MASSANDLQTAYAALADEANILQTLLAQAAGGDPNSRGLLTTEVTNATQLRGFYLASLPDADTSLLDSALSQARSYLGGGAAGGGVVTPGGLDLFGLKLPWVGVGLLAAVLFLAMKKGRR